MAEGDPDEVFTAAILGRTYGAELRVVRRTCRDRAGCSSPNAGATVTALEHAHPATPTISAARSTVTTPEHARSRTTSTCRDLLEPFELRVLPPGPVASATLVGALCGMLGVYIVLRRMSYIGHGLSHSVFGGAVVGYVLTLNFYLAAGLWGFLSALLINATARRRRIGADAAIGIVTTASFAVGVALISKTRSFTRNFEAALFGNILGVTMHDI